MTRAASKSRRRFGASLVLAAVAAALSGPCVCPEAPSAAERHCASDATAPALAASCCCVHAPTPGERPATLVRGGMLLAAWALVPLGPAETISLASRLAAPSLVVTRTESPPPHPVPLRI